MFTSSSFPFASLFPQQSYLGQYYPTYGQSFYQNLQNPIQQQAQQPFMNQQAPMGMFGTQMVNPPHFNVVMEELLNDRMRDIYLDSLIMKLLESSRFYRQSDHLLRTFVEGKTLSKEEAVKNLLADRQKDQDIASIINSIVNERKDRSVDQILAHCSMGTPLTPGTFAVKHQKQRAFDQEIDQAVRNLMNRDTAIYGMAHGLGKMAGKVDDPISNLSESNPGPTEN